MLNLTDAEFEQRIATVRSRYYQDSKPGLDQEEFSQIMEDFGLGDASSMLFEALDHSDGVHPRGSGVIDPARFADGLKVLAGRNLPEERLKFIRDHPQLLTNKVIARSMKRMSDMSEAELERSLDNIRNREGVRKDGVNLEEFTVIMRELGLEAVSTDLFKALDNADGLYPRGSGIIDIVRFVDGVKLLSGRCAPGDRLNFLLKNPSFFTSETSPRKGGSVAASSARYAEVRILDLGRILLGSLLHSILSEESWAQSRACASACKKE
jgi:hypothetical protein